MPTQSTARPPGRPAPPAVALLRWPSQDRRRRRLAALGRPRILLTDAGLAPPSLLDDREEWAREGCDPATVAALRAHLSRSAARAEGRPLLDEDGLLRHAGRWVAIPARQLDVVELLVANFVRLVPHEEVRAAYAGAGRPVARAAIGALVRRLDARVGAVGLRLTDVRRRGVVLAPEGATRSTS